MKMEQFFLIKKKEKKAQIWSLDLIIASIIFITGIALLFVYAVNYSSQTVKQLNELFYEGNLASQLILSEFEPGVLSEGKINQTKLDNFYNYSYDSQKNILGIRYDFYFTLTGLEINEISVSYVGRINATETKNLIQVTRLTIYKNTPAKFQIFIWGEE